MGSAYLVALNLARLNVLVVGGGEVALRKVRGLCPSPLRLVVVAPDICPGLTQLLEEVECEVAILERKFLPSDLADCQLVFAATSDRFVNAEISRLCKKKGVLVNNVSDSGLSTFGNVALAGRGGVTVGVSSGSKVPGFSKALGKLIDEILPAEINSLLAIAAEVRSKALSSGVSASDLDWEKVMSSPVLELIRAGEIVRAEESLTECLF